MPSVLTKSNTMNQIKLPFLPARHRAMPFHTADHATANENNVTHIGDDQKSQ